MNNVSISKYFESPPPQLIMKLSHIFYKFRIIYYSLSLTGITFLMYWRINIFRVSLEVTLVLIIKRGWETEKMTSRIDRNSFWLIAERCAMICNRRNKNICKYKQNMTQIIYVFDSIWSYDKRYLVKSCFRASNIKYVFQWM